MSNVAFFLPAPPITCGGAADGVASGGGGSIGVVVICRSLMEVVVRVPKALPKSLRVMLKLQGLQSFWCD